MKANRKKTGKHQYIFICLLICSALKEINNDHINLFNSFYHDRVASGWSKSHHSTVGVRDIGSASRRNTPREAKTARRRVPGRSSEHQTTNTTKRRTRYAWRHARPATTMVHGMSVWKLYIYHECKLSISVCFISFTGNENFKNVASLIHLENNVLINTSIFSSSGYCCL